MNNKERQMVGKILTPVFLIGIAASSAACSEAKTKTVTLPPSTTTETQISPIETTETDENPYTFEHIDAGGSDLVGNDSFIMGDVVLIGANGEQTNLFDNKAETDLIVDVQSSTPQEFYFKYGGDIRTVKNPANKAEQIQEARQEKLDADRSKGVNEVDIVIVNDGLQKVQGQ